MHRFKQRLLIAAVFTVLGITGLFMNSRQAAAQNPIPGSAPVNIVGPLPLPVTGSLGVTGTVNVRDVNTVVRTPFQATLSSSGAIPSFLTVGADKKLTIEFVTSKCNSASAVTGAHFSVNVTAGGNLADHNFYPKYGYSFGGLNYYGSPDMTRLYADPGTTVGMGVLTGFNCLVTLSGYTVPK